MRYVHDRPLFESTNTHNGIIEIVSVVLWRQPLISATMGVCQLAPGQKRRGYARDESNHHLPATDGRH